MVNVYYKIPRQFVNDPYAPYHRKDNLPDYKVYKPKFLPWAAKHVIFEMLLVK